MQFCLRTEWRTCTTERVSERPKVERFYYNHMQVKQWCWIDASTISVRLESKLGGISKKGCLYNQTAQRSGRWYCYTHYTMSESRSTKELDFRPSTSVDFLAASIPFATPLHWMGQSQKTRYCYPHSQQRGQSNTSWSYHRSSVLRNTCQQNSSY